ncbi:CRISPR-associated protein, CT1975 family [Methylococcus capsulatus str. Bath]|uniref:CRISPR-associated protein, CT1975 family n=1 Tax=Methylococcus capsulatus (strain ATCC 33009 / NCIMB 11132 / Bath) TaxID=243233 RepID=Q60AD1_METCA|nr:type I-E CRISPR-associated protein Cas7/Cse4/CasC [Methylococcus capsulatus]AAU92786.1 CRISPR-associated protein, CT1975 family [Methylococcus capsulatus str. Bath]
MFLQIHSLTSYHATLLNRDDAGLAKRIPFGDAVRLRVSSQCLKRHWRESLKQTIPLPTGLRTRHVFEREIYPRLKQEGVEDSLAKQLTLSLMGLLLQKSDKTAKPEKAKKGKNGHEEQAEFDFEEGAGTEESSAGDLRVKQPILFGRPEVDYLISLLKACAEEGSGAEKALQAKLKGDKANFKAMLKAAGHGDLYAGLEGALFGRFVTSDVLSRSDAAVHVAHSFTVHGLDTEVDYFTVVDDLNREEETGAAHAGDMELGAGLFYGYVAVDIPLLVSNLTGCDTTRWAEQEPADVRKVLTGLIRAIATVSPGAKLGATAPYAFSEFVLLETGKQQPRALSNAYLQALPMRGDPLQAAIDALAKYLRALDAMYGRTSDSRSVASTRAFDADLAPTNSLDASIGAALDAIFPPAKA